MGPNVLSPDILHYIYSYGAIVLLVVLYLLWRPRKSKPSRLKLRDTPPQPKGNELARKPTGSTGPLKDQISGQPPPDDYKNAPETTGRIERQLNVIFQFNGHDFDAYEVFGVPAGSNMKVVEAAYEEILIKTDSDSRKFYEIAYRAILTRSSNRPN